MMTPQKALMNIIDLTHTISPSMPVYPDTETPIFIQGCTIEKDGFLEKKMTMYSHTGTHIDAPAHLIKGAKTLDNMSIDRFHGNAFSVTISNLKNEYIDIHHLKPYQDKILKSDFVLLNTGWSKYWGEEKYFSNYPVLSMEAANWLSNFNLKGLGLDTISADIMDSQNFPIHKFFLEKNMIILENLKNLSALPTNHFMFSCFPLKIKDADGSPVRAVAYI